MTHGSDAGGSFDMPAFPDYGTISTYDPTAKPLTKRQANLWWIAIVLAIALIGFAILWLPSLLP